MTTSQVEVLADRDRLAGGDLNIKALLRRGVLQKFLLDVGDANWRRKYAALTVTPPTRIYNLPDDFFWMRTVYAPWTTTGWVEGYDPPELKYIGEDPVKVVNSEVTTTAGTPSAYYIVQRASDSEWKALKLDCPPSAACTIPYIYRPYPVFENDSVDLNLNTVVPEPLQFALVCGLRAEILFDRYGQRDPRYEVEMKRYDGWVASAKEYVQPASRNYAVFMR